MDSMMTLALFPLLLTGATVLVVMLGLACKRSYAVTAGITIAGLVAAFASVCAVTPAAPQKITPLLLIDRYALFYQGLILASAAVVALLCYRYFEKHEDQREEVYLLLVLATLGCMVLVASVHFVSFLLGLEVLSVSLYGMVAYWKERGHALEAGIKYLVLASASAAFLLFGMALIYGATGDMSFSGIRDLSVSGSSAALVLPGIALAATGIGFKLGVAPFHLWTPDVYQGAPAPMTAFVATTSKVAVVALLLRFLPASSQYPPVHLVFSIIAVASMCAGNFLALRQSNVKRILAYSSIAHFGYVLVAFLAGSTMGSGAVSFYLVAYTATTLAAFGVVTLLSNSDGDADDVEDYRGLFWRRPMLASGFTAALLSLAGIPATIGFLGKFYILAAGADASAWLLMIVLVVTSVAGLFYYLRVVVTMYSPAPEAPPQEPRVSWEGILVIGVLTILLVWLGFYPEPLLRLIRAAVAISA